jgi:hypothetical protein
MILVFLYTASFGFGQVERASIVGTIRDSTGSVIPGVSVKITNKGTYNFKFGFDIRHPQFTIPASTIGSTGLARLQQQTGRRGRFSLR